MIGWDVMSRVEVAFVSGHDLQGDALTWVKPGSDSLAAGGFFRLLGWRWFFDSESCCIMMLEGCLYRALPPPKGDMFYWYSFLDIPYFAYTLRIFN